MKSDRERTVRGIVALLPCYMMAFLDNTPMQGKLYVSYIDDVSMLLLSLGSTLRSDSESAPIRLLIASRVTSIQRIQLIETTREPNPITDFGLNRLSAGYGMHLHSYPAARVRSQCVYFERSAKGNDLLDVILRCIFVRVGTCV